MKVGDYITSSSYNTFKFLRPSNARHAFSMKAYRKPCTNGQPTSTAQRYDVASSTSTSESVTVSLPMEVVEVNQEHNYWQATGAVELHLPTSYQWGGLYSFQWGVCCRVWYSAYYGSLTGGYGHAVKSSADQKVEVNKEPISPSQLPYLAFTLLAHHHRYT